MGKVAVDTLELENILSDIRSKERTIVTTNGVFDILHVGHVRSLQFAKSLGDILIVGINSDSSARRYKGDTRPFVHQAERAELLAALSCVDYVTIFDDPTPERLLGIIRPNVHVKGGDYNSDTLPEAKIVQKYGGRLEFIPYLPGHSTTDIITRIVASAREKDCEL